jgi:glycosyltransferase involved in cell wall biosynthesis
MRVHLVNDVATGPGSSTAVHHDRLVRGLREAGDDVELFAGEVVHRGPSRALELWDPIARRRLAARAAEFRPDVVHHHHVARELSSAVLGVPSGVPQVLTVHDERLLADGAIGLAATRRLKGVLDRMVVKRQVDLAVAVSEPLAEALREAGFPRVVHLPPFADPPADRPPPPSACLNVAFAGRLTGEKGFGVLADAWPLVLEAHPWARLCVAGSGPMALRLSALDRVDQHGAVSTEDVREMLVSARVVVVPSVPGNAAGRTPTVAIEAALCGRPLVVSDAPALAAFAEASGACIVTRAGDARAVAAAVVELLGDDALADRLGTAGATYAGAHHTTAAGVAALRAQYDALLR